MKRVVFFDEENDIIKEVDELNHFELARQPGWVLFRGEDDSIWYELMPKGCVEIQVRDA